MPNERDDTLPPPQNPLADRPAAPGSPARARKSAAMSGATTRPDDVSTRPTEGSLATVVILDFGAQYGQLIARRVREANVYSELLPWDTPWASIAARKPAAIILSGGPESTLGSDAPGVDRRLWDAGIPVLGICYGLQLIARDLGGTLVPATHREYGPTTFQLLEPSPLTAGVPERSRVWMSHGDTVETPPPGFTVAGRTPRCTIAALGDARRRIFGVQFHPEVVHTEAGQRILSNFLHGIAAIDSGWGMESFVDQAVDEIRRSVGKGRVICALSGGVDSAVAATLVARAIGERLTCIFVDTGLLRLREAEPAGAAIFLPDPLTLPATRGDTVGLSPRARRAAGIGRAETLRRLQGCTSGRCGRARAAAAWRSARRMGGSHPDIHRRERQRCEQSGIGCGDQRHRAEDSRARRRFRRSGLVNEYHRQGRSELRPRRPQWTKFPFRDS